MDTVPTGLGTDHHQGIALAFGDGGDDAVALDQPHGHGIDQGIAGIGLIEIHFAGYGGDAEGVTVVANPAHDAVNQIANPGIFGISESKGVERRDGSGAHGENITKDTADTGGRSLIGLDGRGVIMRLDFEDHGQAVADINRAGVFLTGLGQQAVPVTRQGLDKSDRVLVRTMLRPHHRENTQFGVGHFPTENFLYAGVFFLIQTVGGHHFRGHFGLFISIGHSVSFALRRAI